MRQARGDMRQATGRSTVQVDAVSACVYVVARHPYIATITTCVVAVLLPLVGRALGLTFALLTGGAL